VAPEARRPAIVFAGAPLDVTNRLEQRVAKLHNPFVVAADSGARTALAFGLRPDLVVGDFDSTTDAALTDLEAMGLRIERHPVAKDATDGQLALQRALELEPSSVLLLGYVNGPRLDMTLSGVLLLGMTETRVTLADEHNECILLRGPASQAWSPEPDEVISLLPLDRACSGVTTSGLRYPLNAAHLKMGDTRGLSNEPNREHVEVRLAKGKLLLTRHFPTL